MKTYQKNGLPAFSPNGSAKDSMSPTMADSKSSINLCQSFEEAHKYRETTYLQGTAKSTNRQFLRYTMNLKKSDVEELTTQITTCQNWKNKQKFVPSQAPTSAPDLQEYTAMSPKPSFKYEKRNSNPERKEEAESKQTFIPKFLEKKTQLIDKISTGISKTEKAATINSEIRALEKKTFTPKTTKIVENRSSRNINEVPFYSSEFLQMKFGSSPTCESSTSRVPFTGPKISDFKKIKFLGEGRFGQVHLAYHIKTNAIYALKQIKKDSIQKNKMEEQLLMEIKMQFYLNHPNILKLYGVFDDQENIYLILEFMEEGTLYSQLKRMKKMPQDQASRKLKDVLDGVSYLHRQQIAHRDIKPENIVISNDVCKLCDLGWAAVCENRRKTLCGTIDYASPEVLEGKEYGIAIDLWCLGVLCFELMVGKCPFYHTSRKETMKKIINTDKSDLNIPENLTEESKNFIERLLLKNPEDRMTAEEAFHHPLITLYHDEELEELKNQQNKKF